MESKVFGPSEFAAWLDQVSRERLGVSGEEFVRGYGNGRFDRHMVAHDMAAVLPLLGADAGALTKGANAK